MNVLLKITALSAEIQTKRVWRPTCSSRPLQPKVTQSLKSFNSKFCRRRGGLIMALFSAATDCGRPSPHSPKEWEIPEEGRGESHAAVAKETRPNLRWVSRRWEGHGYLKISCRALDLGQCKWNGKTRNTFLIYGLRTKKKCQNGPRTTYPEMRSFAGKGLKAHQL